MRRAIAGLVILGVSGGAVAAKPGWPAVQSVLKTIPTAAGEPALDRMGACGMKIDRRSSWAEPATQDVAGQGIKAGDVLVEVYFDLPRPGGAGVVSDANPVYTGILARWYIRAGRALPQTGWAENIQNKKAPLDWMAC